MNYVSFRLNNYYPTRDTFVDFVLHNLDAALINTVEIKDDYTVYSYDLDDLSDDQKTEFLRLMNEDQHDESAKG